MANFSIEAIRDELERIKSHKAEVDNNYQRKMLLLKSPDPNSSSRMLYRNRRQNSTVQKRDMATSISAIKQRDLTHHLNGDDADGSDKRGEVVTGF